MYRKSLPQNWSLEINRNSSTCSLCSASFKQYRK